VTLALETESERAGKVALWGAPTLTGGAGGERPNVIFYVIDGAGADWMSLYGYNRPTTPFLERLAGEAVVFEQAYSNATATPMSTPSYMTSLLYSAIDRYRATSDKIPAGVTTMAEHFGRVGYQTGVFVSNPFAATMSGLERGVDLVRVLDPPVPAVSSEHLHRAFWDWREAYLLGTLSDDRCARALPADGPVLGSLHHAGAEGPVHRVGQGAGGAPERHRVGDEARSRTAGPL
jgi:hypothetical protein